MHQLKIEFTTYFRLSLEIIIFLNESLTSLRINDNFIGMNFPYVKLNVQNKTIAETKYF